MENYIDILFKSYLEQLTNVANQGDDREESYYSCLENLLNNYTQFTNKQNFHITTLPKKTEAGNPDFRIWDGNTHIRGYIEAKPPKTKHLETMGYTEQLKRYRGIFHNLILTNFYEFILYRNGQMIDRVFIGRPAIVHKLKDTPPLENKDKFLNLLEKFFSFSLPKVYNAEELAIELAKKTRFLKDEIIFQQLKQEEEVNKGNIIGFYLAFKEHLISGLTKEAFADLYSQTITYGLFAARTRFNPPIPPLGKGGEGGFDGFNRKLAYNKIPKTIGILRDIFQYISLGELPKQLEWILDDISEVLSVTDVYKILDEYYYKHKGKDPIVHFYETFLAEYDPKTRKKRGVYYTPEPIVSYIVNSLNHILKEYFDKPLGFANEGVTVFDPAGGTLTFLSEATNLAVKEFILRYGSGSKDKFLATHILKNFYAFELMMAPYAIGHLKIAFLFEELGYKLKDDDRVKFYLTNTLEMDELKQTQLPGLSCLSEESYLAGKVKKEQPILVILGNPPYSYHSTNTGDWIVKEIKAYYQVDGKPLGEKNPKGLQDDYVKFIRFAQWKIEQAGEGVLGFITNHSYLDNPTFRGMRQSLMQTFDEIYILDLHGNTLKREKCPDGSKDENVFDIQQGVAIALFVKKKDVIARSEATKQSQKGEIASLEPAPNDKTRLLRLCLAMTSEGARNDSECKISHSDLWGLRQDKYNWLKTNNIKTTKWKQIKPKSEFYLFIPRDERRLKQYKKFIKITDIFSVNSVGVVTARDNFATDYDKQKLNRRFLQLKDKNLSDEIIKQTYSLKDNGNWNFKEARDKFNNNDDWKNQIIQILYRPFDKRWIFYDDTFIERARKNVMKHFIVGKNLGLITSRIIKGGKYQHTFISENISNASMLATNTSSSSYLFPLYLYEKEDNHLFNGNTNLLYKTLNIGPDILEMLKQIQQGKEVISPEQIFFYIYAILYSNIYRTKYAEFLKIDFPRIPFTKDFKLFSKMAAYGNALIDLHLLKSSIISTSIVKFQGNGDSKVQKIIHKDSKVYINETQYFEGIGLEIWQYHIGEYQVLDRWLKDRKGKELSLDEIKTYCQIAISISETIKIQIEIDRIYNKVELVI